MLKRSFMGRTTSSLRIGGGLVIALVLGVRSGQAAEAKPSPTPAAEASPRPPLILAVAIDETAIGESDLLRSQELVLSLLGALPPHSQILVASFSGEKRIVLPPTADRGALAPALAAFKAGTNGVALPDGLFDIVEYVGGLDTSTRAVLLVSAGRVREGDLQFEDPLNAASARHIPIFALAVGQGEGKLLRRIARITGGEYVRLEVADAATLARSIASGPPPGGGAAVERPEPTPSPRPAGRTSTGLLGAAAVFFSLGGLLMLGIVFLLIRRLATPAADKAAPPPPAPGPLLPTIVEPPAVEGAREEIVHHEDEPVLERTLVVNANPILRALSGPGAGKNFPVSASGQTSIGRSRSSDIVVPENAASAQHCRIDREGDSYVLHDLGSTNGTWVNGARTERAVLQHGDRLKVGETVFTVSLFGDRA
jgi:hypothetical protein